MTWKEKNRRITIAILVSLWIHLTLGLFSLTSPRKTIEPELQVLLKGRQIADINQPEREEKPEQHRFLGLYDSKVDEEKVASSPYIPPQRRRVVTGPDGREVGSKRPDGEGPRYASKSPSNGFEKSEEGEDLASILPDEFFPNIRIGEKTYLNVLRYPKISYFVRMKKIIKLTWNPQPVVGHYYFSNQIAAGQIETTLALEIHPDGSLKKLFVYRSSGFPLYDQEAVRAIEDSAPFASPPEELLDRSGVLPLIWTFTVYL